MAMMIAVALLPRTSESIVSRRNFHMALSLHPRPYTPDSAGSPARFHRVITAGLFSSALRYVLGGARSLAVIPERYACPWPSDAASARCCVTDAWAMSWLIFAALPPVEARRGLRALR